MHIERCPRLAGEVVSSDRHAEAENRRPNKGYAGNPVHLESTRVERYAEVQECLPPVVVFDTGDGLLLVDGYHRVEAAKRRGVEMIEAEVRVGSRREALEYVASANGLDLRDVVKHIQELHGDRG